MAELREVLDKIEQYLRQQVDIYGAGTLTCGLEHEQVFDQFLRSSHEAEPAVDAAERAPATDALKKQPFTDLSELSEVIASCQRCQLAASRKHVVVGYGNPRATLMFIGEAPGREEDLQGAPFVGPAGKLLDRMLHKMGFSRDEVYIANVLKCRPPGNRDPLPEEIETCFPHLEQQIQLIKPRYIFCLGKYAANRITGLQSPVGNLRGRVHKYREIPVFVTYHPAALLRNQNLFWEVFKDMQLFRKRYDAEIGDKPPMPS